MLFPTIFSVNTCLQHYGFHREENVILSYTQLVTVNISLTAYPVKDNVNAKSVFLQSHVTVAAGPCMRDGKKD